MKEMPVPFIVVRVVDDGRNGEGDLVCSYANEAAASLLGSGADRMEGVSLYGKCPPRGLSSLALLADTARRGIKHYFTYFDAFRSHYCSVSTYRPREGLCACVLLDVTDRVKLEDQVKEERRLLESQALRDPLTGLYHVRQGRLLVMKELARRRRSCSRSALFMFDVDDFKKVNDEHGHPRGDAVLKKFAQLLEESFRSTDIVFRAGGDEFSAFISDVPCACVAERICAEVIKGVERISREFVRMSVSVGVAVGLPSHTHDDFYTIADRALYSIKQTGKSTYRIADMDVADAAIAIVDDGDGDGVTVA